MKSEALDAEVNCTSRDIGASADANTSSQVSSEATALAALQKEIEQLKQATVQRQGLERDSARHRSNAGGSNRGKGHEDVCAHCHKRGHRWDDCRDVKKLNLTDEQRRKLKLAEYLGQENEQQVAEVCA